MKKIAILGSTGSIGTQTLDIVRLNEDLKVTVLTANKNINLIFTQILEFCPEFVCIFDIIEAGKLKERLEVALAEGKLVRMPEIVALLYPAFSAIFLIDNFSKPSSNINS